MSEQQQYDALRGMIETLQKNLDLITEQIREDRKDINQVKIDIAKISKATGVIIENQNQQEETLKETVKEEAEKIPQTVEKMFQNKGFLKRLKEKVIRK